MRILHPEGCSEESSMSPAVSRPLTEIVQHLRLLGLPCLQIYLCLDHRELHSHRSRWYARIDYRTARRTSPVWPVHRPACFVMPEDAATCTPIVPSYSPLPLFVDFSAHSATIGHGYQVALPFCLVPWFTTPSRFVLTPCARRLCLGRTEQNYARSPQ